MDFLMGKWPPLKKGGVTVAKEGLKKGGARREMEMGGGVAEKGWRRFPPDHSSIPCHHPEMPYIMRDETG